VSFGVGPVFWCECLRLARRWQTYALRSLLVGCLLVSLVLAQPLIFRHGVRLADLAAIGSQLFLALVGTQLVLILLAAPASMAGAICDEKARGNLAQLLATGLSATEIVLGKLASRLVWVLALLGCSLPVLFLAALLGGIDAEALLGAFAVTFGLAVFACALALALSVEGTRTHEVLLTTYAILSVLWIAPLFALTMRASWIIMSLVESIPALNTLITGSTRSFPPQVVRVDELAWVNPFAASLLPYLNPAGTPAWKPQAVFLAISLGLSVLSLLWAVLRLRTVALRQADRPAQSRHPSHTGFGDLRRRLCQPLLSVNPVMWHEWQRRVPSRWGRLTWLLYLLMSATLTAWVVRETIISHRHGWYYSYSYLVPPPETLTQFLFAVGLLLLSILSVTGLAEERETGTLEVLLTTPLSTRSIVWGKWWGACRAVPVVAAWPAILALALAWPLGVVVSGLGALLVVIVGLVYAAAFTTLGMALAVWVPRTGVAVALSVASLALISLGSWALIGTHHWDWEPLAGASPLSAVAYAMNEYRHRGPGWAGQFIWLMLWLFAYASGAAVLFWAIDKSIYRCLGRMRPRSAEDLDGFKPLK
jgi:ABC-type transport system involved in multi-copper enzyme maturation permease subunit